MRRVRSSMMAMLTVIATVGGLTAAAPPVATTTVLQDGLGDAVRSDGNVPPGYVHGIDCVASTLDARSGATALRTDSHTVCPDSYWQNGAPAIRQMVLDFSNPVVGFPSPCTIADLNACGSNLIPDVRIETTDAFSSQALSRGTGMTIYVSFHPDLNNTEFYIEYEQPVSVSGTTNTRTLAAGSNAIAELYRATRVKNRYVFTSVGRYYMPMQMTISTN
jgi:hypothetical protein